MKRDTAKLSEKVYDLLIIGGGIYGAAAAWDAASRGLAVALIDKADFGSRNSSNSQKTIHGGLRYMQHFDLRRIHESAYERKIMMRIAPHLVHPMPCLIPTYGRLMRSIMPLVLRIYDLVSLDRSRLKDPQKHIPKAKVISKEECQRLIPGIQEKGLTGGVIWHDCQVYNTERLVLSFVKSANNAGADAANYVEAVGFLEDGNIVKGVKAKDLLNDTEFKIQAKIVLNASGPWVGNVMGMLKTPHNRKISLSKMLVLVVNQPLTQNYAYGIPSWKKFKDDDAVVSKGYRLLFISPWRNCSLIGTAQTVYEGDPEDFKITEADIQNFIEEVNEAYPRSVLARKDVSFFYGGLLPIDGLNQNGDVNLIKRYEIFDHEDEGIEGLISIMSVKYTEGRYVAQKAIDLVIKKLGIKSHECITMETPVQGGFIESFNDLLANAIESRPHGLSDEIIRHLVYNYGSEYTEIINYIDENHYLGEKVSSRSNVIEAEILYGIREEMAQKLADVILRRTELGTAENPGEDALKTCAGIMAEEMGWDESRIQKELNDVKEIYTL